MPRFYFDIQNGEFQRDETGIECADFAEARKEAMKSLPEIARWALPKDGDHRAFTCLVRDEADHIVYTATLTFVGLTLKGRTVGDDTVDTGSLG